MQGSPELPNDYNQITRKVAFKTERLIGVSLTIKDYSDFESEGEPNWHPFINPYRHLIVGPSPIRYRIPRVKADPKFADIGLVLAILKSSNEIVGSAGFHDFPNEAGMIEVGFGIVSEMQNKGFGKELLIGMWEWISQNPEVQILRYTVDPRNKPSMHIINSLPFHCVGAQYDKDDAVHELIFEATPEATGFRSKQSN